MAPTDPDAGFNFPNQLIECDSPFLIGVRHHSAAMSAAVPKLLDGFKPDTIFLEAPSEFADWFKWLQADEAEAPIALVSAKGEDFAFYPFAEFSPEWATIRWAAKHDVPVIPIDISVNLPGSDGSKIFDNFDLGRFWDRAVESNAAISTPEQLRSAALKVGWALRSTASRSERDLARETWMRKTIAEHKGRAAAVIGSFHAAALLPDPLHFEAVDAESDAGERTVSVVRYTHALLDERSGYPAGILDPAWHAEILRALQTERPIGEVLDEFAVSLCRELREEKQGGASVDAMELSRLAKGLARIRNLASPGRAEFVEAAQTVLTQASEGRGRAVARSMETVLVGDRRGKLPKDVPRCGLSKEMDAEFDRLNLPTKGQKEFRLDPLRSKLDRQRHVMFRRMEICNVIYATFQESTFVAGLPSIQQRWDTTYSPSTEATIEIAGLFGVTMHQASAGALRHRLQKVPDDDLSFEQRFGFFTTACEAGLADLAETWFAEWQPIWEAEASLSLLIEIDRFLGQLQAGQVVAIPTEEIVDTIRPLNIDYEGARERTMEAAHRVLSGIVGSTEVADASALTEIVYRDRESLLLAELLRRMAHEGSELMQGAAAALLVVIDAEGFESLPVRIGSWIDNANTPDGRLSLSGRLVGLLTAASLLFETHPELAYVFDERISALPDEQFLLRLPALRKGFDALNDHDRKRLMAALEDRIELSDVDDLELDPELIAIFANADLVAREKLATIGVPEVEEIGEDEDEVPSKRSPFEGELTPADRWRLILGQRKNQMSGKAGRVAMALDQLYGQGGGVRTGFGAGQEDSFPSTREWAEELENLFGERVREEVLADAAPFLPAAVLELNPDQLRPSVDLLQTILPLAGSMSEAQLAKLRPLIQRCVNEVTKMLANRMQPALFGSASARPSRRRTTKLDMPRTIRKNIARVHTNAQNEPEMYPDTLIYKAPQKRGMEWDLYFLVDVSGSMEPSVIYSAIVSAILTGVPWVNLKFLAFNTEVVDLTEHTADPLSLLLEVRIGGGTNIGRAMKTVETQIRVPRRSIVMVLSDFEEGFSRMRVIDTARNMVQAGVKVLGLASLDDSGNGRYNASLAKALVRVGMPVAALSPTELAHWIKDQVK